MRIESLELINLKCFERETIGFAQGINILTGPNNSGKSTIIQVLQNLQYQVLKHHDIRSTRDYARVFTKISRVGAHEKAFFHDSSRLAKKGKDSEVLIIWSVTADPPSERFVFESSALKMRRTAIDLVEFKDSRGKTVYPKDFHRFPDSEHKDNFIYPFLASRKSNYYDSTHLTRDESFKVSDQLRNIAAKVQMLSNASHPNNKEFVRLCEEILQFRIGVIAMEKNNGLELGIFTTGRHMIPLRAMGDGVVNIVGFIVTLLTEDDKLFLIEEVENDIHPAALKKLLNLVIAKANRNQFVISTHSHIVLKYLGGVPDSKIFFVENKQTIVQDGRTLNIPTSSIIEIENGPKARIEILEKLGYDFYDFELYEAYLLLEESSSERIIRDFLIPFVVPELYGKVKTLAAKGVSDLKARAIDFNRLFVYIHTSPVYQGRAWIMADGDQAGLECIHELKSTFVTWSEKHFINFSKNNFEEFYPAQFAAEVKAIGKMNKQDKMKAKKELVEEVMLWALQNREIAVKEFRKSAKEIIDKLEIILVDIKRTGKK